MTDNEILPAQMPKAFDPKAIEAGWYARWEADRLFVADASSDREKFAMCFPPPNITGELHMGHALQTAVYDLIARYKRMNGFEVLFLPGYDHAAIATQNVIEKQLAREGTSKEELGREAFDARVNSWYESVGAAIINQLRLLGASMDWTRLRFTMDSRYYRSVMTAFVAFYDRGWIYRAPRIVNWCPHDRSAISDLEVEWQEHQDTLFFIRYPVEGGGDVTIATVRPETMLADTGVAVNPDDLRYRELIGKTAILPLVGRKLPIVADDAVEKDFGTGALKVTPGHDPLDYEIGQRHGLEIVNGMHEDGSMNVPGLPYDGLPAIEARKRVVEDLRSQGLLVTWFSSALWPFATLGWPDETEDLDAFYPTDINCTAREIINLWVSRMIMTGLEFMGDVPFSDVVIHCVVQAADGRRMSKSLGTGVDPRELIDQYGADALRAWAASVAMSSQDVRFDESRVEGYRRFSNKLWNATRLVLSSPGLPPSQAPGPFERQEHLEDRWILSRLSSTSTAIGAGIDNFAFQDSINAGYGFAWNELCDWYLEAVKERLRAGDAVAQDVAYYSLDILFRLLHPFMPFVTEELWSRLPGPRDYVMRSEWPDLHGRHLDSAAEDDFAVVMEIVEEVRGHRQAAGAPSRGGKLHLDRSISDEVARLVARLASVELVDVLEASGTPLAVAPGRIEFPAGSGDSHRERECKRLREDLAKVEARLANEDFQAKAPREVVDTLQQRADAIQEALDR